MSTRSIIGFKEYDGSITSIYCHFDGYIDHVGKILHDHYNTIEKLDELLDLGNLSVLGKEIGVKHPFSAAGSDMSYEAYNGLYGDMCVSYSRDRGEADSVAQTYANEHDLIKGNQYVDYIYIFDGHEWCVFNKASGWSNLEYALNAFSDD